MYYISYSGIIPKWDYEILNVGIWWRSNSMPKFIVDFELAGHLEVKADSEENAMEIVENMDFQELINNVQIFNVGKNYIEKVE